MKNKSVKEIKNSIKTKSDVNNVKSNENDLGFSLKKENYILLLIGFLVIVIGFILMSGGASDDPSVFSYEIHSFRRISLAPVIVLLGFVIEIIAIMCIPKKYKNI